MRQFGLWALLIGIIGFVYAMDRVSKLPPVPAEVPVDRAVRDYPAARWQLAEYGFATLAGFGVLMAMFPKGR
jgi:hypothetical protein